jgi:hypothetical protein
MFNTRMGSSLLLLYQVFDFDLLLRSFDQFLLDGRPAVVSLAALVQIGCGESCGR